MNKSVEELLLELGKAYYENRFMDPLPEFLPLFDEITAALNEQNSMNEEQKQEEPEVFETQEQEEVQQEEQGQEPDEALREEQQAGMQSENNIRFCIYCGEKIYPGSFFCTSCGQRIG